MHIKHKEFRLRAHLDGGGEDGELGGEGGGDEGGGEGGGEAHFSQLCRKIGRVTEYERINRQGSK